jgi:hypothetical protein
MRAKEIAAALVITFALACSIGPVAAQPWVVSAGFFDELPGTGVGPYGISYNASDTLGLFGAGPTDHDPNYDWAIYDLPVTIPVHSHPFFQNPGFERYEFPASWWSTEVGYDSFPDDNWGIFMLWEDTDGYGTANWGTGKLLLSGYFPMIEQDDPANRFPEPLYSGFSRWHCLDMHSPGVGAFEGMLTGVEGELVAEYGTAWHIVGSEYLWDYTVPGDLSNGEVTLLKVELIPEPSLVSLVGLLVSAGGIGALLRRKR